MIYKSFKTKNGQTIILRNLKCEDLDDFLDLMNSIANEHGIHGREKEITREEAADILANTLSKISRGETIHIVAESNSKVLGVCFVNRDQPPSRCGHSGELGVEIKKEYRNIGMGTELIKAIIVECKKMGLKLLKLAVADTNKVALHVYKKVGFIECGRVPKQFYHQGKYIDCIWMYKEL